MARGARGEQIPMFAANGAVAARPKKPRKRRHGVSLGRRPRAGRVGFVSHARREQHDSRHPVHVSMRRVKLGPSLRSERVFHAILGQLAHVKHLGVRVVHITLRTAARSRKTCSASSTTAAPPRGSTVGTNARDRRRKPSRAFELDTMTSTASAHRLPKRERGSRNAAGACAAAAAR
jgi:hypothetical protein